MMASGETLIRGGTLAEPMRQVREADIIVRAGEITRVGNEPDRAWRKRHRRDWKDRHARFDKCPYTCQHWS